MKTEEMRYLIIRAASFRTLAPPSCSEGSSPEFSVLSSKPDPLYRSMSATPLVARYSSQRCSSSSAMSR